MSFYMKKLSIFLKEALDQNIRKWIKGIFDVEISLNDSNRLSDLNIKADELKRTDNPFEFADYINNNDFLNIIKNKNIGFPFASMIVSKPNEFLNINDKKSEPNLYGYFKTSEDNVTYFVGICMYDINISLIDDFVTLVDLESVNFVKDNIELSKIILQQFIKDIKTINKNYKGIAIKPITDPHKSFLTKIGFKKSVDNENILVYNL